MQKAPATLMTNFEINSQAPRPYVLFILCSVAQRTHTSFFLFFPLLFLSPSTMLLRCKHKTRITEERCNDDLPPCTHLPYERAHPGFFSKDGTHRECVIRRTMLDTLSSDFAYIHAWPAPLSFQKRPLCAVRATRLKPPRAVNDLIPLADMRSS